MTRAPCPKKRPKGATVPARSANFRLITVFIEEQLTSKETPIVMLVSSVLAGSAWARPGPWTLSGPKQESVVGGSRLVSVKWCERWRAIRGKLG